MPSRLPQELRSAVESVLGPLDRLAPLGQGTQARVWLVHPAKGSPVVVKQPHDRASFRLEVDAYHAWGGALRGFVPGLVAALPAARALVLDWIDGSPPAADDTVEMCQLHRQAGEFCRRLNSVAHEDDDPVPLMAALAVRMQRWCTRGSQYLRPVVVDAVTARFDPAVFEGVGRIPAHRDLSPNNWIVVRDPTPRLKIVDFGHARSDAPLVDLLKLWDEPWEATPGSRDAFFDGYGHLLSEDETQQLLQLALLHGVATSVWGHEHGEPKFVALGDAVLGRLLD